MNRLLGILALAIVVAQLSSCVGEKPYHYTDTIYIVNESTHQIYMTDINRGSFPESISLGPDDSAVDNSNVWSYTDIYWNEVNGFYPPLNMVITIDGVCSYAVYYISGSNTCECKSGTCKCGETTAGEYDVKCMCGINVVNPCEYKNWKSKNTYKKRREDKTDWTFTITEEMVEQTLSQLAEE